MSNEPKINYEYWKLNTEKEIGIFHDSVSGITLTGTQVVRIQAGAADFSNRFVQAKQFGHIIPANEDEHDKWLKYKHDMDNPSAEPVVGKAPTKAAKKEATPPATTEEELSAEEMEDLTKPELLAHIKKHKSVTDAIFKKWEKQASEEIIEAYLDLTKE